MARGATKTPTTTAAAERRGDETTAVRAAGDAGDDTAAAGPGADTVSAGAAPLPPAAPAGQRPQNLAPGVQAVDAEVPQRSGRRESFALGRRPIRRENARNPDRNRPNDMGNAPPRRPANSIGHPTRTLVETAVSEVLAPANRPFGSQPQNLNTGTGAVNAMPDEVRRTGYDDAAAPPPAPPREDERAREKAGA